MKILFSPVGMTDPIRYFRDGAMLNIARNYAPDIVYLYMSKEITNIHEADNRYVYCLEQLGEVIGKKFDIRIINRPDLEDVQIFDCFLSDFREVLNEIHNEYPDAEMILNVSSGTPAMKSSLQILSLTLDYRCIPVQVSTPQKKSNPRTDDEKLLTPDELWEINESNDTDDNRCITSETSNLLTEFKKQMIIKLIKAYDYPAAYEMAQNTSGLSDKFKELLSGACSRLKLEYSRTRTIFQKYGIKVLPSCSKEKEELSEYLLLLKIKCLKEEYADFIRAITPAIVNLFEMYLRDKYGVDINDFTNINSKGVRVWNSGKLNGTQVLNFLDTHYMQKKGVPFNCNSPINSDSLVILIKKFSASSDPDAFVCARELRNIEERIRNDAAHTIVKVTDATIKKACGFTADDIFKKLSDMYKYSGQAVDSRSYDKMNDVIIEIMDQKPSEMAGG